MKLNLKEYTKGKIKNKESRSYIEGMEYACDKIDEYLHNKLVIFQAHIEQELDGDLTPFIKADKEFVKEIMDDFKKYLETEIRDSVVNILHYEGFETRGQI